MGLGKVTTDLHVIEQQFEVYHTAKKEKIIHLTFHTILSNISIRKTYQFVIVTGEKANMIKQKSGSTCYSHKIIFTLSNRSFMWH